MDSTGMLHKEVKTGPVSQDAGSCVDLFNKAPCSHSPSFIPLAQPGFDPSG